MSPPLSRLLDAVAGSVAAHRMFEPGDTVGAAVSGGADSVMLLDVLAELRQRIPVFLEVLHVNHQLRGAASEADEEFVRKLAETYGLPVRTERIDLRADAENLEQLARQERYRCFQRWMNSGESGRRRVATGHTRSDQAETVLFRMLRGAGNTGLAGILPVTADGIVRPLLALSRAEVREWLHSRNLVWREDASNGDERFARNRIRRHLVPLLTAEWNPQLEPQLTQLAEIARAEEEFWENYLAQEEGAVFAWQGGAAVAEVTALTGRPVAVARRLLRRVCESLLGRLRGIEYGHIEAVLALAAQAEGSGRLQLPGLDVMRSFDWLRIAPQNEPSPPGNRFVSVPLAVPGITRLPCGAELETRVAEVDPVDPEWQQLPETAGRGERKVRYWLPGDSYRPQATGRKEKIKTMFQTARIPLWERRCWPVVEAGEEIVWARRFGPAASPPGGNPPRGGLWLRERQPRSEKSAAVRNLFARS